MVCSIGPLFYLFPEGSAREGLTSSHIFFYTIRNSSIHSSVSFFFFFQQILVL